MKEKTRSYEEVLAEFKDAVSEIPDSGGRKLITIDTEKTPMGSFEELVDYMKTMGLDIDTLTKRAKEIAEEKPTEAEAIPPWDEFGITKDEWDTIQEVAERYGKFDGSTGDPILDEIMKTGKKPKELITASSKKLDFDSVLKHLPKTEKAMDEEKATTAKTAKTATAATPSMKSVKIKIESDSDLAKGVTEITFNTENLLKQMWASNPEEMLKMIGEDAILEKIGASKALEYFS